MRYTLYNREGSGGFVVEAALALCAAPFDLVTADTPSGTPLPEDFRAVNPWKQVPVLILPDGSTMTESAAILVHLAACHPGRGLAPEPGTSQHARFLRWLVFASVNVYESTLRAIYPQRYAGDPACAGSTRTAAIRRMGEGLAVLDDAIGAGPFLLGDTMSIADVYIAMLFIWFKGTIQAPRLTVLAQEVRRHPVVGPIWRRHYGDR